MSTIWNGNTNCLEFYCETGNRFIPVQEFESDLNSSEKLTSVWREMCVTNCNALLSVSSLPDHLHQTRGLKQESRAVTGQETGWPPTTPLSMPYHQESRARVMCPGRVCMWTWAAAGPGGPPPCPRTEAASPPPLTLCHKSHPCPAANCAPSAKLPTWWALGTTSPTSTPAHSAAPKCAPSVASTPTLTSQR